MTNEKKTRGIDIRKLGAWLDSKDAKVDCPICGHKKWSALNGDNHVGNVIPYGDGFGDMYMTGYPVIMLFCQNCHFVKSIALTEDLLREIGTHEQP